MAVNPIDIAAVTRSQDYSIIKHNEDHKTVDQQSALVQQTQKDNRQRATEVVRQEQAEWHEKGFDAREKGDNEYRGDGGKKRKKEKREQVIVNGHKGFDIKI